jgi:hypothetical protein
MLVLLFEGTSGARHYMSSNSMIYIPSFMKTDACFEATLRFCLSSLNVCNVGTTDLQGL